MSNHQLSSYRDFNLWHVWLAMKAELNPDNLSSIENEVWEELLHDSLRNPRPEDDERFLREINKRWHADGNEINEPLPKTPYLDPEKLLLEQIVYKAPVNNCIRILRQILRTIGYEPVQDVEQVNYSSIYPVTDDDDIIMCDLFYEMRVPLGELTQYCRAELLKFKARLIEENHKATAEKYSVLEMLYPDGPRIYWYLATQECFIEGLENINSLYQFMTVYPSVSITVNGPDGTTYKPGRDMPSWTNREIDTMIAEFFSSNPHIESIDFETAGTEAYRATPENPYFNKLGEYLAQYEAGDISKEEWLALMKGR